MKIFEYFIDDLESAENLAQVCKRFYHIVVNKMHSRSNTVLVICNRMYSHYDIELGLNCVCRLCNITRKKRESQLGFLHLSNPSKLIRQTISERRSVVSHMITELHLFEDTSRTHLDAILNNLPNIRHLRLSQARGCNNPREHNRVETISTGNCEGAYKGILVSLELVCSNWTEELKYLLDNTPRAQRLKITLKSEDENHTTSLASMVESVASYLSCHRPTLRCFAYDIRIKHGYRLEPDNRRIYKSCHQKLVGIVKGFGFKLVHVTSPTCFVWCRWSPYLDFKVPALVGCNNKWKTLFI